MDKRFSKKMYAHTRLWQSNLAQLPDQDPDQDFRERLRVSLIRFRDRAEQIAGEIPQAIRQLTVHDVPRHIDSLWQIADLITGESYELTPAEAYVLGGAFLLHDLGLALASYPRGVEELKCLPMWQDAAVQLLRQELGRSPTKEEIANLNETLTMSVLESVLRLNHARHAKELGLIAYRHSGTSTGYYLIEDADLRTTYGKLAGRIGHSHWWPVERLIEEFGDEIGAMPGAPAHWVIDPLKLACILRAADACHIDARRAPGFLRALRKPAGLADKHWRFQEYIQTPRVRDKRIVFSVTRPVPIEDADAWWVGYELIQLADRELRDVDTVLRDAKRQPFAVDGVAGANDANRLKRHIPTVGWEPVSTELRVADVASLVRKLGGAALYGENPKVPLRELIQNARDAVVARRSAENRDAHWGQITIRLFEDGSEDCVEVRDNGIGMSEKLLCGPFLDFGTSYWHTPMMIEEHPGLAASGFEPQGRFGIGFFSVFMWGERVSVTSRSIHDGPHATRVLEFRAGLSNRPLLRFAREEERLAEPGTSVRVWLATKAHERKGLLAPQTYQGMEANFSEKRHWTLSELCQWLCPAIDVAISTHEKGTLENAVDPNDWQTMDASRMLYRLILRSCKDNAICSEPQFNQVSANVRPIFASNGECIGRAALTLDMMHSNPRMNAPFPIRHTTAGLFRGWEWRWGYVAGLLIGKPTAASRIPSNPIAIEFLNALASWATEQAKLIESLDADPILGCQYALAIRGFGGDTVDLPIARDSTGFVTFRSLAARTDLPSEIELYDDHWQMEFPMQKVLAENQIGVSTGSQRILDVPMDVADPRNRADHPTWHRFWPSLWAAAIEAVSIAWDVPLKDVLDASDIRGGMKSDTDAAGRPKLEFVADTIRNPRSVRRP